MATKSSENNGENNNGKVGAVLVVGAGIGGIQASLDLAEAGFKVYLLDRSPAIGGTMAQLDKTFPTNDCAMCILSPKLVECGRHNNIEVMTYAELEGVEGEPGNFTARVRQKPRYVIVDECTGCGDCAAVCPIICSDQFNAGLSERRAVYTLYPQAMPNAYVIEKRGIAPCRDACPAGVSVQGYIALIREQRYVEALQLIRDRIPFPSVCGRTCHHPCEGRCTRRQVDEPVAIEALKRFVSDQVYLGHHPPPEPAPRTRKEHIAIVGAGPAGLTAAQDLIKQGYGVTVFEALPEPGGMMRFGIPEQRLPKDMLRWDIADILALGVELRLNTPVADPERLLEDEFDAVYLAVGVYGDPRLGIEGEDLEGVVSAISLLRDVNLGRFPDLGKRVAVVGGGITAVDAATTSLRLGAEEVHLVYRRSRGELPAYGWERDEAESEGVRLIQKVVVTRVLGENGQVMGLEYAEARPGPRGPDKRPTVVPVPGTEQFLGVDTVVRALGQSSDLWYMDSPSGAYLGDPETLASQIPGIFAGPGEKPGAGFIVNAIARGHQAATSIHRYLQGEPLAQPERRAVPVAKWSKEEVRAKVAQGLIVPQPRQPRVMLPVSERAKQFIEVDTGFTESMALAEAARCLNCGVCSECGQCVDACHKGCIDLDMREEIIELNVGGVVLVPGSETMPGDIRPELGYGRLPNVVTSIEFERMLSASGPWGGEVRRPSDGEHPRKVAFIQCVGSRDISCDQGYCSSVCCMYATKEAVIAKEHDSNIEPVIFYMDIRSFGKGFERYINRAEQEHGVRYVRSMVSMVTDVPGKDNLRVRYATGDGNNVEEEFDLVVLSVGLKPPEGTRELAQRLGVAVNEYGFAESPALQPAQTTRPGIFVAGPFSEPKDIPETVVEASCAAAQVSALLADARSTLTEERVWPEEHDVSDEDPRVGVFVCHCGTNIGAVVNVPEVVEYAAGLPDVAYAEENLYTCSQDTQQRIQELIEEYGLNRVVVASCTPRTHEPLFQETIRGAGLNPHLFQMANIREQDSWVHRDNHGSATQKAKELMRMAVAKSRQLCPLDRGVFDVNHRALVIGGGLAGMTAAISIAEQGFEVTLVEREEELGGNLRHIYTALPNDPSQMTNDQNADPQALLKRTIQAALASPRISVLTGAEVVDMGGYLGQYRTMVMLADGQQEEVQHGVVVVATGAREIEPQEYLYGEHPGVVTQRELEEMLVRWETGRLGNWEADFQPTNPPTYQSTNLPTRVVMIQCVGSRDEEHPYCSRVCCTEAIKNALAIKERSPETQVYILYRDIRTFGFKERYYREARRKGVVFLQYDENHKPEVSATSSTSSTPLRVDVIVQPEEETFTIGADLVVLSAGIEPNVDNEAFGQRLKVPLSEDGFFLEAHVKLRPLDFAADGVYLCGLAHSPHFLDETIAQAQGAAVRAVSLLARDQLDATPIVACVDPRLCTACGLCVEACPYGARVLEPGATCAEVIDVLCQGCGACITACPNKASQQKGFGTAQVYRMLDAMSDAW